MAQTTERAPAKTHGYPALWKPQALFDDLHADLERLWHNMPWMPPSFLRRGANGDNGRWLPQLDMFEKDGHFVVKADLPGLEKKDVQVTLEGGNLILSGERKQETKVEEKDYFRCERSYGRFERSVALPFEAEADKVQAKFHQGVLEVTIPMPVEVKPETKKIPVT